MNAGECQVGVFDRKSSAFSSPLNVTPAVVHQFDQLFDFQLRDRLRPVDLALIQILLCFRGEVLSLLFLVAYLTQSAVIGLGRHFVHLYTRRRRSSFVLTKKGGFYTVESFIFNSFHQRADWSTSAADNDQAEVSFYIEPSHYLTAKKCVTLTLFFLHLVEIYFSIPTLRPHIGLLPFTIWTHLLLSYPFLSCIIRLVAVSVIVHHLFRQTQPPEQIVHSDDSLSPSIYSRANQILISCYFAVSLLDTALNIKQSSTHFAVHPTSNVTSFISTAQTCISCHWQTLSPLPSAYSAAPFNDLAFFSRHITTRFYFNCVYLCIFLVQLVLAFFSDYDVKSSNSQHESPLESLFDSVTSKKLASHKAKHKYNPEDTATFFSRLTFTWFNSTIFQGFKSPLSLADIFPTSWSNRVDRLSIKFFAYLNRRQKGHSKYWKALLNLRKFKLICILVRQFGLEFIAISFVKLLPTLLTFLSPVFLDRLIQFVKNDEPYWHGFVYVAAMFFVPLVESLLNSYSDFRLNILALKVRSTLSAAIFERMLQCRSWSSTSSRYTSATLINIMSIDTQRVLEFIKICPLFWICPLQIAIAIHMLWAHLGYGSLAGLAVLLLLLPFNGFIGTRLRSLQNKLLQFKDQRLKVLANILSNIRAVKLYAWEEFFHQRTQQWRQHEVANLKRQAYFSTAITFAFNSAPFLVAFASFAMYLLINSSHRLDAQKMFVSLAIFGIVRKPLAFFPSAIANALMVTVSLKRLGEFFECTDESDESPVDQLASHSIERPFRAQLQKPSPSIEMRHCTFSWSTSTSTQTESIFQLNNIFIQISDPKLCVIIGEIGAGKSSLLSAVLGQMSLASDPATSVCKVNGTTAYVPQNAWIQSGSIRDNILFERKYDCLWYQKVVEACALTRDFQQLPDGDQTMVGQKGDSLSGGQKQRISIARALYANADIYLFDASLAALDTQIAKHVFTRVIGPSGLLAGKIRLLVTHNMAILPRVDHILLLKKGAIVAAGQYRELMSSENEFTDFLAGFLSQTNANLTMDNGDTEIVEAEDLQVLEEMAARLEKQFRSFTRRGSVRRQFSCQSGSAEPQLISFNAISSPTRTSAAPPSFPEDCTEDHGDQTNREQIESPKTGSVSCAVYLTYLRRVGWLASICILLFFFLGHVCMLFSQLWLSTWSSHHDKSNSPLRPLYEALNATDLSRTQFSLSLLGIYGLWGLGQTIFILLGTLVLNIGCLRASRHLHNQILARIMNAPLWFFDASSSSTGQILNRFSRDLDIVDTTLISNFLKLVIELFRTIASFCPIIFGTDPAIILIFIPLTIVYFAIYKFCIATSRQLIRLEAALRTPIYNFFSEAYEGVSLIQAFSMEKRFIRRNYRNIDKNASAYHMSAAASRWMTIRLELLGNLVVLSTAIFCVLKRGQIDSGMVGLCMSCAFTVTSTLNMLIRSFTDLESNIVSVERLVEFTELPQEAARRMIEADRQQQQSEQASPVINCLLSNCVPLCSGHLHQVEEGLIQSSPMPTHRNGAPTAAAAHWLRHGDISICQYSARYRDGLDFCLRDLNLFIKHGTRVAIIGRTGAGKSSFALALFRLIESDLGCISISGRNIKELGLQELRSSLTIIPQEALLFSGTLRENMDPLNQYSDDQILVALAKVNLTDLLLRISQGPKLGSALDQPLDESRLQAISAGQRQLLALARVLLRQPKVLIMDEAYASIDPATEELVQETVHREFDDCTVLSIVHSLDNVLRYRTDRVLVLDSGRVVEFDSPRKLASDQHSQFYQMLHNRL